MTEWPAGPASPAAPEDAVHVWLARLDAWPSSPGVLREVLGRYLGEAASTIELRPTEAGKPELARGPERLRFNLSHSGALALIAVSGGREVGVDVERAKPGRRFLALAERVLEPAAVEAVRAADPAERAAAFYAQWTRHEARIKCLGGGFGGRPARRFPVTVSPLDVGGGYAAALAVEGVTTPLCQTYRLTSP